MSFLIDCKVQNLVIQSSSFRDKKDAIRLIKECEALINDSSSPKLLFLAMESAEEYLTRSN